MPRIAQYENPITGLQPTETGIESTAAAARRSGMFFNQVAGGTERVGHEFARIGGAIAEAGNAAVDYMDHEQIHKGALAASALIAGKTNEWNQTFGNSDPNDPTVAAKFMDGLNTDLENLRGSMLTERSRNWMEAHTESIRNHFTSMTISDSMSAAGVAVHNNVVGIRNNLAEAAYRNPAGLEQTIELAKEQLGSVYDSSGLKGIYKIKAKTEGLQDALEYITERGFRGALAKSPDPEGTYQRMSSNPKLAPYIAGDSDKWAKEARSQIRAQRQDQAFADSQRKQYDQDVSDAVQNNYEKKLFSDDPAIRSQVTTRGVVNDDRLTKQDKHNLISRIEHELKPQAEAGKSHAAWVDMMRKVRNPDADPIELKNELYNRIEEFNKADFNDVQKEIVDRKTPDGAAISHDRDEFMKRFAGTIDGYYAQYGLHSALGQQKIYEAEQEAKRQEQAIKKQGQDPHSLYDPNSPNYFGKPQNIRKFQVSFQDAERYNREIGKGAAAVPAAPSKNLTAPGTTITGVQYRDIPSVGEVSQGYRFKGGDPSKESNWEKVK